MTIAVPDDRLDSLLFRGRSLPKNYAEAIAEASCEAGVQMVSEVSLTFNDPDFKLLWSGYFTMWTPVTYRGMNLVLSVIETQDEGRGKTVVKCRPKAVVDLRKRRGKLVMNNVTATDFIRAECRAVGAKLVAQETSKRQQIVRDVKEKGQSYSPTDYPSSWTTFVRLADECGYLVFEYGGVIYFGTPTWLASHRPKATVKWTPSKEDASESWIIPEFRESLDSEDIEVRVEVPLTRYKEFLPGNSLVVTGFPKYSGTYLVTNVSYPIVGPGTIEVTAQTTHKIV